MAGQELSDVLSDLTLEQLSVDEEGRVTVADPEIAERLRAVVTRKPVPTNGNCSGCTNTVRGCGGTTTTTNIVKGCGSTKAI
jgi:hypothetical protein